MTKYRVEIIYKEYGEDEDAFSLLVNAETTEEAFARAEAWGRDVYGECFISADYDRARAADQ